MRWLSQRVLMGEESRLGERGSNGRAEWEMQVMLHGKVGRRATRMMSVGKGATREGLTYEAW